MADHERFQGAEVRAQEVLTRTEATLRAAVSIVDREDTGRDPLDVFPSPSPVRAEGDPVPLTPLQVSDLEANAAFLGFGHELDILPSEIGLSGAIAVVEGGQPHKMYAEIGMLMDDTEAKPKYIMVTASPFREVKSTDERASAQRLTGRIGQTEYNVAGDVVNAFKERGFVPHAVPRVWGANYDVRDYYRVGAEPNGQFVEVGTLNGVPVVLMQINRIQHDDGTYLNQPTTADVVSIIDEVMHQRGDDETPLVHITSAAYPSREIGVVLAGLTARRLVGSAYYGNRTINRVKGTPGAAPPLGQMPGELRAMAEQAASLRRALQMGAQEATQPIPPSAENVPTQPRNLWESFRQVFDRIMRRLQA